MQSQSAGLSEPPAGGWGFQKRILFNKSLVFFGAPFSKVLFFWSSVFQSLVFLELRFQKSCFFWSSVFKSPFFVTKIIDLFIFAIFQKDTLTKNVLYMVTFHKMQRYANFYFLSCNLRKLINSPSKITINSKEIIQIARKQI